LQGGKDGECGVNKRGDVILPSKVSLQLQAGERLTVETPGGGGWNEKQLPTKR
jgi:N-methylhydantoinase B